MPLLVQRSVVYAATGAGQLLFYAAALLGVWTGAPSVAHSGVSAAVQRRDSDRVVRFAAGERITLWDPSDRLTVLPPAASR